MPSLHLVLTLESDVVLTSRGGSTGGHQTHRHIPGASLLGAVASVDVGGRPFYESLGQDAFRVFHSGAVRFGCGWPDDGQGHQALPMPRSFHVEKGASSPGRDHPHPMRNLAVAERRRGIQLVQQREGFVGPGAALIDVRTRYSMRTAVGATGRAREGLLFGYEAIEEGQRFLVRIDADSADDRDRLGDLLADRVLYVGRSRSAEFGRVRVEESVVVDWPLESTVNDAVVVLFASNTALRDADTGEARLAPRGDDLGLPGWTCDDERSFLRVRAWSPFHGKRGRPDVERQVIEAGSVLVLRPPHGVTPEPAHLDAARDAAARGIGDWREEGLGQVLVQPRLLLEAAPVLQRPKQPPRTGQMPVDELGAWLRKRSAERDRRSRAEDAVDRLLPELRWMTSGRDAAPPSQWSNLRRLASRWSGDGDALLKKLKLRVGLEEKPDRSPPATKRETVGYGKDRAPTTDGRPHSGRGAAARRWSRRRRGSTAGETLVRLIEQQPGDLRGPVLERLAARMAAQVARRRREET